MRPKLGELKWYHTREEMEKMFEMASLFSCFPLPAKVIHEDFLVNPPKRPTASPPSGWGQRLRLAGGISYHPDAIDQKLTSRGDSGLG